MSKQWDAIDLQWDGIEDVQVGDTIIDEDGRISKVIEKYNGVIWTEPADKPLKPACIQSGGNK